MALEPETLEQRQLETRRFDTTDGAQMLRGVLVVLQDDGYQIDEMDADLGVLTGTRPNGGPVGFASVVARPVGDPPRATAVRVTFQGARPTARAGLLGLPYYQIELARCGDAAVYQIFFDRLSRAVSLEARAL